MALPRMKWTCIARHNHLQRSSHTLSVIGNNAFIFGGELIPRQPRDNAMFSIPLQVDASVASFGTQTSVGPTPSVGSASARVKEKIYLFSGRGGTEMAPIDEKGGIWEFDTSVSSWTLLTPKDGTQAVPEPRSYHCMTSDGISNLFVHAGCPETGRLSDLWQFSLVEREWRQLTAAPGPSRGGTSIVYAASKIWRMNGFDGQSEQGGSVDIYDTALRTWSTKVFSADGRNGPEARSVGALLALKFRGADSLLTLFGEHDPSAQGHAGAGKMLDDIWLYDIAADMWTKIETVDGPTGRGWFDADVTENSQTVVAGGLDPNNERLQDLWVGELVE